MWNDFPDFYYPNIYFSMNYHMKFKLGMVTIRLIISKKKFSPQYSASYFLMFLRCALVKKMMKTNWFFHTIIYKLPKFWSLLVHELWLRTCASSAVGASFLPAQFLVISGLSMQIDKIQNPIVALYI